MRYSFSTEKLKSPISEVPLAKENSDDEEVECSKNTENIENQGFLVLR